MDFNDIGEYKDAAPQEVVQIHLIEETDETLITSENMLLDANDLESVDDDYDGEAGDDVYDGVFDLHAVHEYRALRDLYRGLPKDMFVMQVLKDYNSSEPDLERVRSTYFEHLKHVVADFPYGTDAELKRRVYTRSGEPVATKLAQDIHCIIEVTEDGDCNVLKPLISTSKNRKTSVTSGVRPRYHQQPVCQKEKCSCANDVLVLKDVVSSLQADLLLLKQAQHASDKLRIEQINYIKTVINQIKEDINICRVDVQEYMKKSSTYVQNLTANVVQSVLVFEDRVRLLESFIDTDDLVTIATVKCKHCDLDCQEDRSKEPHHGRIGNDAETPSDVCVNEHNLDQHHDTQDAKGGKPRQNQMLRGMGNDAAESNIRSEYYDVIKKGSIGF